MAQPTVRDMLEVAANHVAKTHKLGVRPAKAVVHNMPYNEFEAIITQHKAGNK